MLIGTLGVQAMLSAERVLDEYFLDTRCMLLEIASMLDRYDASVERDGGGDDADPRLESLRQAIGILGREGVQTDRAEELLRLFSDPVD
jgi:hypothetical protein